MLSDRQSWVRLMACWIAIIGLAAVATAQSVPIVQPGAPGQASRTISADEAIRIADTRFSPDDVRFMRDMIVHHQQAIDMAALVRGRTNRQAILDVARRIDASQADELAFMRGWLRERGQAERGPADAHAMHSAQASHSVPGMATAEQMAALAASKGTAFDRLFLERMIRHHEGAVKMAEELLKRPGSAYDPVLFDFVNEVINDQKAEIKRMSALVPGLLEDRRANLASGFRNAGQAIHNLALVASLPKPSGFFDPKNPSGGPPAKPAKDDKAAANKKADAEPRSPLLSFANTDMAFAGELLAVGSYHGFNLYRLDLVGNPRLISSVICPGGQGDLSIVGHLLIMSVEQTRGRVDCGRQGVSQDVSPERFRGLRIFDIRDPMRPVQVGQVQTCRGSHTHSVVYGPGADGTIIVYASGTSTVRKEEELKGCVGDVPGDVRTALFRIDVVEIPVAAPSRARIVASPAVFADPQTGSLAGLWRGGDHGEGTQEASRTDECHDITVFPSRSLAAGACSGNGILFDISDPRNPRRLDAVVDPGFAYWHSATFNNDGTKVLFTDEWGGGSRPRCRVQDPRNWGANAIYDVVEGKLRFRSHYKLPAPQTEQENCVAHNGSIVAIPGRDIFVQAWYQGGISVIDFTDSAIPVEIAFFDRGPIDREQLVMGGFWSAYWYRGRIYGTEIARGLDVFELRPSEHLTANEIAAAALANQGDRFNPQQQFPVTWPDHPVVALAYVNQLQQAQAVPAAALADLRRALGDASSRLEARQADPALGSRLDALAARLEVTQQNATAQKRLSALRQTLRGIAAKLR